MNLSNDFSKISNRLLTFAGGALFLKIIPLEQASLGGNTLGPDGISLAIGVLSSFSIYLLVHSIVIASMDSYELKMMDRKSYLLRDMNNSEQSETKFDKRFNSYWGKYRLFKKMSEVFYFLFPIAFTLFVVYICNMDIAVFWRHIFNVIFSENSQCATQSVEMPGC